MNKKTLIAVIIICITVFLISYSWLYWLQIKPSRIKILCNKQAEQQASEQTQAFDKESHETYVKGEFDTPYYKNDYSLCLNEQGD
jgi:uncharacterized protein YpmB